jgi:hypothetical protein
LLRGGRIVKVTLLTFLLALVAPGSPVRAAVQVVVGATPIVDGEAKAPGDITVINEKLAFALAVESAVPYGAARGALIDVAPVTNGKAGRDCVVFADFIPNNWSAWPNTYQHVEILERGPEQARIRTLRDWGAVTISTVYTLKANADYVDIQTTMSNGGSATLRDLLSGLTLWPKGGFFLGVPGLSQFGKGSAEGALADRVVAYDQSWTVTLHAPYFDHIGSGSRDLYRLHTLAPGQTWTIDGRLQVSASGDLEPVIQAEIERKHLRSGVLRGVVKERDGAAVDQPVIVIEKHAELYAWVLGRGGRYELTLPEGTYTLYATAKNHSQSRTIPVTVTADTSETRDFHDVERAGLVHFRIVEGRNGKTLDARIAITEGQKPSIGFLGRKVFFTELDRKGQADVLIAPGEYQFTVSSSGGFLAESVPVKLKVMPGRAQTVKVAVTTLFDPTSMGWYSADMHHHSDQAEAVTPPADLARSELAAGLNLLFVSDHDSTVNHAALQRIADRRRIAFIPSVEFSPSWGHFNAYPLILGQRLAIDPSTAAIDAIFKEARRQGAIVVQVNHPFIPYGYFASLETGSAKGGFDPTFDLIEINAANFYDDQRVLHRLWDFWNAGQRYYLSAGTDTHDVWNEESGRVRTFAHIDAKVTAQTFAEALKAGHAYVTYGPLIYPSAMFGEELRVKSDQPFVLGFALKSVDGLKQAELIGGGTVLKTDSFAGSPRETHVQFSLTTKHAAWYALVVEDRHGRKAYTNPVWVAVDDSLGATGR